MKAQETTLSRIFILRLEHSDRLPDTIQNFCRDKGIARGICFFLGGIKDGGRLVEGPKADTLPIEPVVRTLSGVHEIVGLGTVFPDEDGIPSLHAHASAGRDGRVETGCIRPGVETWHVLEVILFELGTEAGVRRTDPVTGFSLLDFL
jgi:predicted DNA-binding protein with PD1-like motif